MTQVAEIRPNADAGFRAYRVALIHAANETAFISVAALVLLFNAWDWYIDAANALSALWVRLGGAALIVASGILQRRLQRVELAPWIAKFRLTVSAGTIAGALVLLEDGFLVGLSGLIIAVLGSAYSSIDRRDVFLLYLPPLLLTMAIMALGGVERFVFVNATCFLGLTLVVALLLASVLEDSYRRAYELEKALLRESRVDALTGVDNRRALEEQARAAISLCRRNGQPISVLLIDIDHFKRINDGHGHPAGDRALCAVAEQCHGLIRESDRFGRWGGEEFLVLLPETPPEQALALAERMRTAVAGMEFASGDALLKLTISVGVAGGEAPSDTAVGWAALVKAADDAMYRAKSSGRNRVVMAAAS